MHSNASSLLLRLKYRKSPYARLCMGQASPTRALKKLKNLKKSERKRYLKSVAPKLHRLVLGPRPADLSISPCGLYHCFPADHPPVRSWLGGIYPDYRWQNVAGQWGPFSRCWPWRPAHTWFWVLPARTGRGYKSDGDWLSWVGIRRLRILTFCFFSQISLRFRFAYGVGGANVVFIGRGCCEFASWRLVMT